MWENSHMTPELKTLMTENPRIPTPKIVNDYHGASFIVYGDSRDNANSRIPHAQEIYKDARGFYQPVQFRNPD